MSWIEDAGNSLLGISRNQQNETALSIQNKQVDLNKEILALDKQKESNKMIIIIVMVIVFLVISFILAKYLKVI